MVDKQEIQRLLNEYFYFDGEITIYDSGVVDVSGEVRLDKKTEKFPVQFGRVGGSFICEDNQLTSLQGAPSSVGGIFSCSSNQLTSLQGAPSSVGGKFYCHDNKLTSLQGAPSSVGGSFDCSYNKLTSLQGAPSNVGDSFICEDNQLTSLQGAPSSVDGKFTLDYSPNLPLLRTIVAKVGVSFENRIRYPTIVGRIEETLNQFKGQGKRGVPTAIIALLKLEKELQKEDPSINIRENIKW